jgi:hypothetical protein
LSKCHALLDEFCLLNKLLYLLGNIIVFISYTRKFKHREEPTAYMDLRQTHGEAEF